MQKEAIQDLKQTVQRLRDRTGSAISTGDTGDGTTIDLPTIDRPQPPTDAASHPDAPAVIDLQTMTDPALERGLALFRRGDYLEARDIFRKVAEARPEDARAWYLEALADGLTTGSWSGRPERLVGEGLARERAGTPPTSVIDATLADLTDAQGRDWLAARRRGLSSR